MHAPDLLRDVGFAIIAAAASGWIAFRFGLPLLLAYLAAGVALGPHLGLGVIKSAESISILSEIGLVLLMFILGLEIDVRKLLRAGKAVFVTGTFQLLGCAALALVFFRPLAAKVGAGGNQELVYFAVMASLSSTLVVVKILSDRLELDSLTSRISLGLLVLQDVWAIGFLAVQPNLNDLNGSLVLLSISKAALLVVMALLMARYVLPSVFAKAGKHPELMLVSSMAWCFGMCAVAGNLHLSIEMGALIAGTSIASFPYHVDIAAKVSSLRDFFITLFFVALGLQVPWPSREIAMMAGALVFFVWASRFITIFPVLHFLRLGNRGSLLPALNLSQVSEFALVLAALGVGYGHIRPEVLSAFVLALVASILLSALAIPKGHELYRLLNPLLERIGFGDSVAPENREAPVSKSGGKPIVLLGFYREASSLLEVLCRRHSQSALDEIRVVDFNPEAHRELNKRGVECVYGDISNLDTLAHLKLHEAQLLICTIPDRILRGTNNLKLLRACRQLAPRARVIVTAETFDAARKMYEEGADYVMMPRIVDAHYLAEVLERMKLERAEVIREGGTEFLKQWTEVIP